MESGEIGRIWAAIYGNPAWSVQKGHGSFLTFEFGAPSLRIREPKAASSHASERIRAALAGRRVHVIGNWTLWIYCCNWSICFETLEAAHSESPDDTMGFAVERLDGQQITSVARGSVQGSWIFTFDLGGKLETWPYGDNPSEEQWLLYERESGRVLIVRADDHFAYGSSNETADDHVWHLI